MSIEQTITACETAPNANDALTILDLHGAAPVLMPQGAPARVGRDALRHWLPLELGVLF